MLLLRLINKWSFVLSVSVYLLSHVVVSFNCSLAHCILSGKFANVVKVELPLHFSCYFRHAIEMIKLAKVAQDFAE
jgi:hypothetical protein